MRPLLEGDFPQAALLLHEGFPKLSKNFWLAALARLRHYGGNAQADVPLGWFMMHKDQPVGVMLTPASLRTRPDGSVEKFVNLSSWYVRPAHRWRAGFMLRSVMADKSCIYTDLTPTPEVQLMLPKLGFTALNRGVLVHALPLLALLPARDAVVRALAPGEPWTQAGPPAAMIDAHRDLGCLPLVLETASGQQLLVVQRVRVRGIPGAQLIYAASRSEVVRCRAALARHLLGQGMLLLVHDTPHAHSALLAWFRPRDLWFASGDDGSLSDRTDAFASELCIVHGHAAAVPLAASSTATPADRMC